MKIVNDALNYLKKHIMRRYEAEKDSQMHKLSKYHHRLLLKNKGDIEMEYRYQDKILGYLTTERDVLVLILSIDEQLRTGYYLKE